MISYNSFVKYGVNFFFSMALYSQDIFENEPIAVIMKDFMPDFTIVYKFLSLSFIRGSNKGADLFRQFNVILE